MNNCFFFEIINFIISKYLLFYYSLFPTYLPDFFYNYKVLTKFVTTIAEGYYHEPLLTAASSPLQTHYHQHVFNG